MRMSVTTPAWVLLGSLSAGALAEVAAPQEDTLATTAAAPAGTNETDRDGRQAAAMPYPAGATTPPYYGRIPPAAYAGMPGSYPPPGYARGPTAPGDAPTARVPGQSGDDAGFTMPWSTGPTQMLPTMMGRRMSAMTQRHDQMAQRLEAIEARLANIERLLEQR